MKPALRFTFRNSSPRNDFFPEKFGDKKVTKLSLTADNLDDKLMIANITYVENGKQLTQNYLKKQNKLTPPADSKLDAIATMVNKVKNIAGLPTAAISSLNFDEPSVRFEEAKKVLPSEFQQNSVLNTWVFEPRKDGKATYYFIIDAKKEGEKSTRSGRNVITKYNEFTFNIDEKGKLTMQN